VNVHEKLNYVEFPAVNIAATKAFFNTAFGWTFEDFGPEYTAFSNEGLDGGFFKSEHRALTSTGSALLVFYSDAIEDTLDNVTQAGGTVVKSIFEFPGGCRFHFTEPSGNEFAVWSDKVPKP